MRAGGVNPADAKAYARAGDPAALPMLLGFEAAGVVTAVGDGAADDQGALEVGDEVIVVPGQWRLRHRPRGPTRPLTRKPPWLGWAEAACPAAAGATAFHALTATGVGEGDTVLVHGGAGGVGLYAVQLARLRGARVIATASESSHALLRDLGAEPVVYGDGLLERVRALAPDGVDAALDLVGTDEAMDVSLALVPDRARVATIADFAAAPQEGIAARRRPGSRGRSVPRPGPSWRGWPATGRCACVVAATYPLDEAADAHRQIAHRPHHRQARPAPLTCQDRGSQEPGADREVRTHPSGR